MFSFQMEPLGNDYLRPLAALGVTHPEAHHQQHRDAQAHPGSHPQHQVRLGQLVRNLNLFLHQLQFRLLQRLNHLVDGQAGALLVEGGHGGDVSLAGLQGLYEDLGPVQRGVVVHDLVRGALLHQNMERLVHASVEARRALQTQVVSFQSDAEKGG
jgi:hypothetical protein